VTERLRTEADTLRGEFTADDVDSRLQPKTIHALTGATTGA
jgi:hypothetical protein